MTTENFFVKLNLDFSTFEIESSKQIFTHGYGDTNGTINFFNIEPETKQQVIAQLPLELHPIIRNVRVAVIKGQIVAPHIDHRGSVNVNYHIVSGNAKTTFWSAKTNAQPFRADGEYTDNVYKYDDVVEECFYIAENNSCYLINTGKIHDVTMESADSVRKILQLTFDPSVNYDVVLDKMSQLNLVI
jgi:dihydroneopterin aldolase